MNDKKDHTPDENENISRREFFVGLKKWSKIVIGGVIAGAAIAGTDEEAQAYSSWINRRGGWANRPWNNWSNRGGSWLNGGGGGGWINRRGGGGIGWMNR